MECLFAFKKKKHLSLTLSYEEREYDTSNTILIHISKINN